MGASVFFSGSDEIVTVTITYTVAGVLTDPTTLSWTVTSPLGVSTVYTWAGGGITHNSVGSFTKEITCASAGDWVLVSDASGAAADANEVRWQVFASNANLYCSVESLKSRFGISDTVDDFELQRAVRAASRRIESYCDRDRFWRDAAVQDLVFDADSPYCVRIKGPRGTIGISTATGLVVKTDEDGDGIYERTLTITTDFLLKPFNAVNLNPAWPYETIEIVGNSSYRLPMIYGRPGVQVTARFGWPAVPDDVSEASLILAHRLFERRKNTSGVVGFDAIGATVRLSRTDPDVAELLDPYRKLGIA